MKMKWTGRVTRIGGKRNAYRVLLVKPVTNRPRGRSRLRWEDNIKIALREIGWDGMN
jgi:hypothetical protein